MIVGDDPMGYTTVPAEQDIMIVGDDPIGETIEVEVSVQHSYYVDAFKVAQQVLLAWCPW